MTDADLVIRDATPDDVEILVAFNRAIATETEGKTLDPDVVHRGVLALFAHPDRGRYFLAEIDGQVVGQTMITFEWSDWRAGTFWWIQSVYVQADARGRGVFTALFRHVEALARCADDVCGLRLYVEKDNQTAMTVYRRMGLTPTGHLVFEHDWSGRTADAPTSD